MELLPIVRRFEKLRFGKKGSHCTGFVCILKNLEFLESKFKALKVLEIGFWSLKVLDFFIELDQKIMLVSLKLNESQ